MTRNLRPEALVPLPPDRTADLMELERIWQTGPGWGRLAAVNHHVIGIRFIVTALVFFAVGGALAMLIRVQLASPGGGFMPPSAYAQLFTMHGTVMMFLFAIPLLEGIAMVLLPKMLGARDLAFPRLSAYGYWCYLFGGLVILATLVLGLAPQAGWFMYTPLSSAPYSPEIGPDLWLLGITFVEISAIAAAVEFSVSILRVRAPGMSLARMPVFAWFMLVVAAMMLLGFPPLMLGSLMLEAERAFGLPFFDPTRGGDPLLWQHLFWLFGHPEVYIIFLPAAGVVSTIVPVFARHPLVGRAAVVVAAVAIGLLSFGLWIHHMFTTGLPHLSLAVFSVASVLIALPTGTLVFAWIATLAQAKARPALTLPMHWTLGFLFIFVAGGLTGVMLALVPFNGQVHDTHFVVAHLHYVLVGGFLFPMVAALYHWLPLVSGRQVGGWIGKTAFWLVFIGFNTTFLVMHWTGLMGMPRRVSTYAKGLGWEVPNLISSIGSFVMAAGFAMLLADLVLTLRFAPKSRPDPWRAGTLEWASPVLPPPAAVFPAVPAITTRADTLNAGRTGAAIAAGDGLLARPRFGWMETIGVDPRSGAADQIVLLPARSMLPLFAALATGGIVLSLVAKLYPLAGIFAAVTLAFLVSWPPHAATARDHGPLHAGKDLWLPLHSESTHPPALMGLTALIVADAAALACLIFGGLFLAISAGGWTAAVLPDIPTGLQLLTAASLIGSFATADKALRRGYRSVLDILGAWMWALAVLLTCIAMIQTLRGVQGHAAPALHLAMYLWLLVHAWVGMVLSSIALWRRLSGHLSDARRTDLRLLRLWHGWLFASGLVVLAFPHALRALVTGVLW